MIGTARSLRVQQHVVTTNNKFSVSNRHLSVDYFAIKNRLFRGSNRLRSNHRPGTVAALCNLPLGFVHKTRKRGIPPLFNENAEPQGQEIRDFTGMRSELHARMMHSSIRGWRGTSERERERGA